MSSSHKIAILGAGPSGLLLARLLSIAQPPIPCTVYERDASSSARSQGGTLDLREGSGQLAIRSAGLLDEFRKLARYDAQMTSYMDKDGNIGLRNDPGDGDVKPEIDRILLRELLLKSLPEGVVRWGHGAKSVTAESDGTYSITFDNGSIVSSVTLLVGADGTWSKVRPLLTSVRPEYSGISMVETQLSSPDTDYPETADLVGKGLLLAFGQNKALIGQRNGDNSIRLYITSRVPSTWINTCGIDFSNPSEAREKLLAEYEGWSDKLRNLIKFSDDSFIPRRLYALPAGSWWERKKNATMIGDAAHVMTPFSGEGVNNALHDALELGEALVRNRDDFAKAIEEYEENMFPRSEFSMRKTASMLNIFFQDDAPKPFLDAVAASKGDFREFYARLIKMNIGKA